MPDSGPLNWDDLYQHGTTPWEDDSPWPPLGRLANEVCPPGASVLEVGCGYGVDAVYLASLGYRVKATDLSSTAIVEARSRAEQTGADLDFQAEDFYAQRDDEQYDLIYDKGVMVNAQDASMRNEFSRIVASRLTDGGHWISVSGNDDNRTPGGMGRDGRGYPRLTVLELATAIEPYFEIQSITQEDFGSTSSNGFRSWVVTSRKRG